MEKRFPTIDEFIKEADNTAADAPADASTEVNNELDKDAPKAMSFEINGKKYLGVFSTFKAIAEKQKAMGEESVGIVSMPNSKAVYELFLQEDTEKSN